MKAPRKHIASCSFGKDSIATILLAKEYGDPIDDICYVEIMFDKKRNISAEHKVHRDFIYNTAIPKMNEMGLHVSVVIPEYDYIDIFYKKRKKGPYIGKYYGFPLSGMCAIAKECKTRAIKKYNQEIKNNGFEAIHYVGIAADEKKRLESLHRKGNDVSLLEKYSVSEAEAVKICKENGLYSPLYKFSTRGGCWFCPNAKHGELRQLWESQPELLKELAELEKNDNLIFNYFNGYRRIKASDIIENFMYEDMQMSIFDFPEWLPDSMNNGKETD